MACSKYLKKQIRIHIRTIGILQEQQRRHSLERSHGFVQSGTHVASQGQSSLVQLARSMANTGHVPEHDRVHPDILRPSPSSSMAEHVHHPDIAYVESRRSSWSTSIAPLEHEVSLERIVNDQQLARVPAPSNSSTTIEARLSHDSPPSPNGDTASSRGIQLEFSDSESVSETSSINPGEGADYLDVYPAGSLLDLTSDEPVQKERGFLATPNGKVSISVVLDHKLDGNLVAEDFAIENGLQIEDLEEQDRIWIKFGRDNLAQSTGEVVLEWSDGPYSQRLPFRVRCWVCAHPLEPVIFGKQFLKKRDHYWGAR
jgi:hypothetical protein